MKYHLYIWHKEEGCGPNSHVYSLTAAEKQFNQTSKDMLPDIVWMAILDDIGGCHKEYCSPQLLSFLNKCYKDNIDLSPQRLTELERNNKKLFDKYLEYIYNETN